MFRHLRLTLSRMDWTLMLSVLLLVVIGVLFIYSASHRSSEDVLSEMSRRQSVWAIAGLVALVTAAAFDYRKLSDSGWVVYAAGLVLLVLVLMIGRQVHGAQQWLNVFGIQVQPSEFAKLGVVVAVSAFLAHPSRDPTSIKTLVQTLAIAAAPIGLILAQPDFGTAMTLVPVVVVLLFVAGSPPRYMGILALAGMLLLPVVWFTLDGYQKERIHVFLDPGRDPLGTGWNSIQSQIAVGSGGLTGKGYLQGTQNVLGYLPRTVAPTDFVFSVIGEETGFVGSVFLLSLYGFLLFRAMQAAAASRDKLGRLLCAGFATLIWFHVVVNMGMTIGLMPITGLPLPLVSYGGSFMVCTMAGLGLVQSVYTRRHRR